MALSSFSEVSTAIATWINRTGDTELEASIPDFLRLAELDAQRRLRVGQMLASTTITLTDGVGSLPSDYVQYRRIWDTAYPDIDLTPGTAESVRGFKIAGSSITAYPTTIGTLGIDYYQEIPALTSDNPTNWLLENGPDIYLYGALIAAMPFTHDDSRMGVWGTLREQAYQGIERQDVLARYARAGRRRDASRTP